VLDCWRHVRVRDCWRHVCVTVGNICVCDNEFICDNSSVYNCITFGCGYMSETTEQACDKQR